MKKILSPKYNSNEVEQNKYKNWVNKDYFYAGNTDKKPFSIILPPPNVTGKLHLGHAWDGTIQDTIARYKRLKGYDVLWLPGMDHAGIATQALVEEKLRQENKNKYDLGREKFLEVSWEWKEKYAAFIREQWAKLGMSLDYSKERFTLDDEANKAVNHVFVTLYKKGLLYRGERIINWDPVLKTALSNIEVVYKEVESKLYYFKYILEDDKNSYLEVATTRPETMFADVCVVVNPKDKRYEKYIGKNVINPSNNMSIPVIADEYVDVEFGTGAMKCTPAHDANDFIIGQKHNLEMPVCLKLDGSINELGHKYEGMDRFDGREALVNDLKKLNLVTKIEKHINQVGHSERSDAVIEPYLSMQWFVNMKPLANNALKYQSSKEKVEFIPKRFEKIFSNWMNDIEDWCISRQLWWGHRIPAWYHKETGDIYVDSIPPKDIENYIQDEDVLDTWFSSGLWPFTTLGWPNETELFKRHFPTDVLVTGYDIIFFWVSRMIFQSLEFTGNKPFNQTLIHGLIRAEDGHKMSKSLGNGVDPMDVIDEYGTDALRHFLITNSAPGLDLRYSDEKVRASWNFINKIWNSARFVMMNLPEGFEPTNIRDLKLNSKDKWIIHLLNKTNKRVQKLFDEYEFVIAGNYLYNFIWNDFCSWYIELAKVDLNSGNNSAINSTNSVLYYVLDAIVKMIHPIMPFVSEEIYHTLHDSENISLNKADWPNIDLMLRKSNDVKTIDLILQIITTLRSLRAENNIAPNKMLNLQIELLDKKMIKSFNANKDYLHKLAFINEVNIVDSIDKDKQGQSYALASVNLFIPIEDLFDKEKEIERLTKEKDKIIYEIERANKMLSNVNFISKAPKDKIKVEQDKLENYKIMLKTVETTLNKLK